MPNFYVFIIKSTEQISELFSALKFQPLLAMVLFIADCRELSHTSILNINRVIKKVGAANMIRYFFTFCTTVTLQYQIILKK